MNQKQNGFTLIQTVVSIVILATVLTAATTLMGTALRETRQNQKRITALYLAQECLELTRNLRDSCWMQNLPWDCGFKDDGDYIIDTTTAISISDQQVVDPQKSLGVIISKFDPEDSENYENSQILLHNTHFKTRGNMDISSTDSFEITPFTRILRIIHEPDKDSALLSCSVEWEERTSQKTTISHILSDWKK